MTVVVPGWLLAVLLLVLVLMWCALVAWVLDSVWKRWVDRPVLAYLARRQQRAEDDR